MRWARRLNCVWITEVKFTFCVHRGWGKSSVLHTGWVVAQDKQCPPLFLDIVFDRRGGSARPEGHWVSSPPTACLAGYQVQGTTGAAASWSFDSPGRKTPLPQEVFFLKAWWIHRPQAASFGGGRKAETWECRKVEETGLRRRWWEGCWWLFMATCLFLVNSLCSIKLPARRVCPVLCAMERPRGQGFLRWGWRRQGMRFAPSWWALFSFFTSSWQHAYNLSVV